MADLKGRYPLSTASGQPIPLDVVRPHGVIEKTFTAAAGTAAMDVPAAIDVFSVLVSEDCIIQFAASSASAAALVDGTMTTDTTVVIANVVTVLSPPIDKRSFSLRGRTASGVALINLYENWSGASLSSQITRR